MIRIAFVVTSLETGGAETMLLRLLQSLNRSLFSPFVISLGSSGPIGEMITNLNIPVYYLGLPSGTLLRIVAPGLRALRRLRHLLRTLKPDILQGWMYHGNLAAQVGSFLSPHATSVVWNIRAARVGPQLGALTTTMVQYACSKLSKYPFAIVNNSRASAKQHSDELRYPPDKWRVIPNGFDTDVYHPSPQARMSVRADLGIANDAPVVGLVARFDDLKDHRTFIRAAAVALAMRPAMRFVLAGRGVSGANATLSQWLHDASLMPFVYLLGERADIARITASFDIATNTSVSEGFANSIGEAMSCGVPCVVTDVGDSSWIVADTGRIVAPRDHYGLARAWVELLDLPPLERARLGMRARARVIDNFSLPRITREYEALYRQLHELQESGLAST